MLEIGSSRLRERASESGLLSARMEDQVIATDPTMVSTLATESHFHGHGRFRSEDGVIGRRLVDS